MEEDCEKARIDNESLPSTDAPAVALSRNVHNLVD
jgi:hypothetical protein